jgi:hypothetical protein
MVASLVMLVMVLFGGAVIVLAGFGVVPHPMGDLALGILMSGTVLMFLSREIGSMLVSVPGASIRVLLGGALIAAYAICFNSGSLKLYEALMSPNSAAIYTFYQVLGMFVFGSWNAIEAYMDARIPPDIPKPPDKGKGEIWHIVYVPE